MCLQGRIRELEEIRAELAEKELVLLGKEQELLERDQSVQVLREEASLHVVSTSHASALHCILPQMVILTWQQNDLDAGPALSSIPYTAAVCCWIPRYAICAEGSVCL